MIKNGGKTASEVERSGEKVNETTFEEAFELTGHGRFNHIVLLTCGLMMLNVSMESVGMSYVIPKAECDLELTSQHKGLINAAAFIGIICTSFLWGYLGDLLGRRAVMLPAMLGSAVVSIISSFSTSVWMLLGLRILTGCLVSASSATVYAYLGEMHTNARRASAIAWGSVFISFSFMILPGLAWLIVPGSWSFHIGSFRVVPWRAFIWSWCVPGVLASIALMVLPESPRYLYSAKGPEAALPVLAKMYAWNNRGSVQEFPRKIRKQAEDPEEGNQLLRDQVQSARDDQVQRIVSGSSGSQSTPGFAGAVKNISYMFRPPLLKCVFISHISMFAVFMLSSGLYVWVPDILNNILQNKNETSITICEIIHEKFKQSKLAALEVDHICKSDVSPAVFPISMAMGLVFALTYLSIGVFINKLGRKTLYCGIMFVCGAATIGAVFVPNGAGTTALLILALCSGCAASILAAIAVDVFPTCLRAMAMCVMYMVGRMGAAVGSYLLGATLDTHCQLSLSGLGAFICASIILMVFWPAPEKVRSQMEQRGKNITYPPDQEPDTTSRPSSSKLSDSGSLGKKKSITFLPDSDTEPSGSKAPGSSGSKSPGSNHQAPGPSDAKSLGSNHQASGPSDSKLLGSNHQAPGPSGSKSSGSNRQATGPSGSISSGSNRQAPGASGSKSPGSSHQALGQSGSKSSESIYQAPGASGSKSSGSTSSGSPGSRPTFSGLDGEDREARHYDSAFELTGEGWFNVVAVVACSFIFVHSLLEMIAVAYVLDPMECDLKLTVMQKTLVGSAIFIGVILTAICWGALGDTYGRKKVMLPAIFVTIVASTVSSLCTKFWSMFLTRLITGALVSASSATVLVYLGELHTLHYRDKAVSYALTAVSAAFCLTPAIAWAIIPGQWSFSFLGVQVKPWRTYIWVFSACGLIGAIMLIFLPESPSYVIAHQGERAAMPILAKMYRYNHLKTPNIFPVKHLQHFDSGEISKDKAWKRALKDMAQLFRYPIRRPFLILHYSMFMVFLLANGVYLWMPGIFNLVLKDTKLPYTVCKALKSRYSPKNDDFSYKPHGLAGGDDQVDCTKNGGVNTMVYPMSFVMEVVLLVPFIIITVIINKYNKCKMYAAVMGPCAAGLVACVAVPQVLVASLLMTIGICSGSAASLLSVLAVDAFPINLRALVMCTMYMMGQVGAIIGNTFMGLAAKGQCEVVIVFLALLVVGSIVSMLFFWPNLDEVRKIMESRHFVY
ncbi:major facilitator superfamily domain-containing protein [Phthorimaea operculella]|nr:major facilitator superfamily domain-containing protein [Phthorimaea operculella]